ncbi:hypothetical protein E2C01_083066 [Portunus trituberculatus]|uniref:Uncharacterized protein n=1 Tax=Portunus trituberculatus TaxID=210409 RepID=A0A5B7IW72_PORTR|nr:hypothetical protein [Portunus trituberculatus]
MLLTLPSTPPSHSSLLQAIRGRRMRRRRKRRRKRMRKRMRRKKVEKEGVS